MAERAVILNRIADVIETHLTELAGAETRDNGKPVRETRNADLPLPVDRRAGIQRPAGEDPVYFEIGRSEGAKVVTGGERAMLGGDLKRWLLRSADDLRR